MSVTEKDDGTIDVQYKIKKAGARALHVSIAEKGKALRPIKGSPFDLSLIHI